MSLYDGLGLGLDDVAPKSEPEKAKDTKSQVCVYALCIARTAVPLGYT